MICENNGCENEFFQSAHNQKFCSSECLRDSTNRRVREKYRDDKDRLKGKQRVCSKCKAKLSRYNSDTICNFCKSDKQAKLKREILGSFDVIRKQN
jgi:hypothetical protein